MLKLLHIKYSDVRISVHRSFKLLIFNEKIFSGKKIVDNTSILNIIIRLNIITDISLFNT